MDPSVFVAGVSLFVAGMALVQVMRAQRRVDAHKAVLAEYFERVDKRLATPAPNVEAVARRGIDAALERSTPEAELRRVAFEFARLEDERDNGQRDFTDAQLRVAVGAELHRRKSAP